MRARLILGLAIGGAALPAALWGQNIRLIPTEYYGFDVDTSFTIALGGTRNLRLYGSVTGGVAAYSLTIFFDTTRVRLVRADSVAGYGLPAPTVTPLANGVTLSAAGTGTSFGGDLANLVLEMKATATSGSFISLRTNQWTTQAGASVVPWTLTTDLLNTCLARVLWGDPDSSLSVTGRDALIALTSAVQLPTPGFDLSVADVDADQTVTSRDALIMLSYAVGGSYYSYYDRAGAPIAAACAPLAGVPSEMVFIRNDAASNGALYRVAAGDTVAVPLGSPTPFGDVTQYARWSPDGTKVLATAYTTNYAYEPIAVTLATLAEDTLARNAAYDGWGTYSPDGTRIAFFSNRATPPLFLMDADGANPAQAQQTTTVTNATSTNPAWSPDGLRVAFTGYPSATGGSAGLWSVRVDSGTVRLEFPASSSYPPTNPTWSPAGDSLVFQANLRLYAVAAPDTATAPRLAVSLPWNADYPTWTSAGLLFRMYRYTSNPITYDYYLRQPDGRILPVYRSAGTSDVGASFR